jgi:hypothetical protein
VSPQVERKVSADGERSEERPSKAKGKGKAGACGKRGLETSLVCANYLHLYAPTLTTYLTELTPNQSISPQTFTWPAVCYPPKPLTPSTITI